MVKLSDQLELLRPVPDVPVAGRFIPTLARRYGQIYEALELLDEDWWLPVSCSTEPGARSLAASLIQKAGKPYEVSRRGRIVYARKKVA